MSAEQARTEAGAGVAAGTAASADSEEKDVKIPVEDAVETADEKDDAPQTAGATDSIDAEEATMTEEEMVEAAIRAGEQAADDAFKLKFEQAQKELADVRSELDAAAEAQKAAEDKAREAAERTARLQADWENFRRRTANERLAERDRATEKLVTALLPVVDDIERAIDHARTLEMADDFSQFVDGVVRILDMKERSEERERENEKLRSRVRQLEEELHEFKMQKKITALVPRDGSGDPQQVLRGLLGQ